MTFIGNGKRPKRQLACMTAYPSRRSINFHYCFLMVHNDTVRTLFLRKKFKNISRTLSHFPRTSIQYKKESWVYVSLSSSTTWAILKGFVFAPRRHLRIWVGLRKHRNSRKFHQRLQFSRTLKTLNFQGASEPARNKTRYRSFHSAFFNNVTTKT